MNEPNIALESQPFLLVSDIHADIENLNKILQLSPKDIRYRCFLGDAIGYGPNPAEVVHKLSEFDICILGNHESLLLGRNDPDLFNREAARTVEAHKLVLSDQDLQSILNYSPKFKRKNMLLFHGTPEDENEYPLNEKTIGRIMKWYPKIDLFFGGHLHIPRVAVYNIKHETIDFEEIKGPLSRHVLDLQNNRYMINCPSVTPGRHGYNTPGGCTVYHSSQKEKVLTFFFTE